MYGHHPLEVFLELAEMIQHQQALGWRSGREFFVLENPGVAVGYEDGVQTGRDGWVDVGFRAVADHPCGVGR
jgi:hypothetical protein